MQLTAIEEANIRFRLQAFEAGRPTHLTVGEAGVFLTAVNRSVNGLIGESGVASSLEAGFRATAALEPDLVEMRIVDSRHGSLEVQAVIDILNAVGLDQATAKGLLVGILGNAIWDPARANRIAADFGRAVRRLGRAGRLKAYRLTLWVEGRITTFNALTDGSGQVNVSQSGNLNDSSSHN